MFKTAMLFVFALVFGHGMVGQSPEFPESFQMGNVLLKKTGTGVRRATAFKVKIYTAALYQEDPSEDPLTSSKLRSLHMRYVRSIQKKDMQTAWTKAISDACMPDCQAIATARDKFIADQVDVSDGQEWIYIFKATGVEVRSEGRTFSYSSPEFSRVLISTWLGPKSLVGELRDQLLGRK